MRFFIALEIPEENKPQLQAVQQKLHTLIPQVRLTDLDKVHLTFAFIGEQPDSIKNSLIQALQISAKGIAGFEITPAYIDGFPNIHYPRIVWAGVKGDVDRIIILRERIKDALAKLGLDTDERRFIPHITIAKLNNNIEIPTSTEGQLQNLMSGSFSPIKISSIKLFESVPEGGFHRHNTLAEVKLD